jgi:hypothetical protein
LREVVSKGVRRPTLGLEREGCYIWGMYKRMGAQILLGVRVKATQKRSAIKVGKVLFNRAVGISWINEN